MKRTGEASTEQIENFEKFMASEHIDHEEIDRHGNPGHIRSHDFSYLAFIDHDKSGQVFLQESRDGGTGINSFPTSLATVGLMGLGSSIFQPGFASALDFTCEGLGQWRGKPAWLMYFRQKPNQQSYLRLWQTQTKTVEVPLKGRVWVAATTYQVLHVETDLREPMKELELTRDHLAIDYGPVPFQNGKTELWLPVVRGHVLGTASPALPSPAHLIELRAFRRGYQQHHRQTQRGRRARRSSADSLKTAEVLAENKIASRLESRKRFFVASIT